MRPDTFSSHDSVGDLRWNLINPPFLSDFVLPRPSSTQIHTSSACDSLGSLTERSGLNPLIRFSTSATRITVRVVRLQARNNFSRNFCCQLENIVCDAVTREPDCSIRWIQSDNWMYASVVCTGVHDRIINFLCHEWAISDYWIKNDLVNIIHSRQMYEFRDPSGFRSCH